MVEVQVYDASGKPKEKISFDESVFGDKVKTRTLREVVYAYEANRRQGTVNTKNLSDVNGSNKKMWKQKGTGRARTGQKHAPHRVKGSVAHGPHPRSFRVRLPAKQRRLALASALLSRFRDGSISVVDGLSFEKPQTRKLVKMLDTAGLSHGSLLLGLAGQDSNFYLSARNIPRALTRTVRDFNALEVMKQRRILLTRDALNALKGGVVESAEAAGDVAEASDATEGAEGAEAAPAKAKAPARKTAGKKPAAKAKSTKTAAKKPAAKKTASKGAKGAKKKE